MDKETATENQDQAVSPFFGRIKFRLYPENFQHLEPEVVMEEPDWPDGADGDDYSNILAKRIDRKIKKIVEKTPRAESKEVNIVVSFIT